MNKEQEIYAFIEKAHEYEEEGEREFEKGNYTLSISLLQAASYWLFKAREELRLM